MSQPDLPLKLGTKVPGYGKVEGVRFDGERYYFLVDSRGIVSFMPAEVIEKATKEQF